MNSNQIKTERALVTLQSRVHVMTMYKSYVANKNLNYKIKKL